MNPLNYWKFFSGIEMKILMRKLKKQDSKKISEEVADVLLYLLRFSEIAELDLEKICLKKIKKNAIKYPIKFSKGKSEKYTSFRKKINGIK